MPRQIDAHDAMLAARHSARAMFAAAPSSD